MAEIGIETKNKTIKSIQLLRAIAALSVVYVHCTTGGGYKFPSTGSFGVDIFFIISGFIIAYMVERNTERFFIKRVFRVAPLYIITTIMMIMIVVIFPNIIRSTTVTLSGFIKSVLFIPGRENGGVPIFGQGWTLNFEMFFT
jgi:peptidoglycan/LPS O-acetylase OafA/YrhL